MGAPRKKYPTKPEPFEQLAADVYPRMVLNFGEEGQRVSRGDVHHLNDMIGCLNQLRELINEPTPLAEAEQSRLLAIREQLKTLGISASRLSTRKNNIFLAHREVPWRALISFQTYFDQYDQEQLPACVNDIAPELEGLQAKFNELKTEVEQKQEIYQKTFEKSQELLHCLEELSQLQHKYELLYLSLSAEGVKDVSQIKALFFELQAVINEYQQQYTSLAESITEMPELLLGVFSQLPTPEARHHELEQCSRLLPANPSPEQEITDECLAALRENITINIENLSKKIQDCVSLNLREELEEHYWFDLTNSGTRESQFSIINSKFESYRDAVNIRMLEDLFASLDDSARSPTVAEEKFAAMRLLHLIGEVVKDDLDLNAGPPKEKDIFLQFFKRFRDIIEHAICSSAGRAKLLALLDDDDFLEVATDAINKFRAYFPQYIDRLTQGVGESKQSGGGGSEEEGAAFFGEEEGKKELPELISELERRVKAEFESPSNVAAMQDLLNASGVKEAISSEQQTTTAKLANQMLLIWFGELAKTTLENERRFTICATGDERFKEVYRTFKDLNSARLLLTHNPSERYTGQGDFGLAPNNTGAVQCLYEERVELQELLSQMEMQRLIKLCSNQAYDLLREYEGEVIHPLDLLKRAASVSQQLVAGDIPEDDQIELKAEYDLLHAQTKKLLEGSLKHMQKEFKLNPVESDSGAKPLNDKQAKQAALASASREFFNILASSNQADGPNIETQTRVRDHIQERFREFVNSPGQELIDPYVNQVAIPIAEKLANFCQHMFREIENCKRLHPEIESNSEFQALCSLVARIDAMSFPSHESPASPGRDEYARTRFKATPCSKEERRQSTQRRGNSQVNPALLSSIIKQTPEKQMPSSLYLTEGSAATVEGAGAIEKPNIQEGADPSIEAGDVAEEIKEEHDQDPRRDPVAQTLNFGDDDEDDETVKDKTAATDDKENTNNGSSLQSPLSTKPSSTRSAFYRAPRRGSSTSPSSDQSNAAEPKH